MMLSVIATTRSSPLVFKIRRTVPGWRCRPSQITSQKTRSSSSTAPQMAGSCWCSRRMALPVWVAALAPAAIARRLIS